MNILLIGLGSIGRRHLTNLRVLQPDARITVLRLSGQSKQSSHNHKEADRVVHTWDEALEAMPDAALITGPSVFHVEQGIKLAQLGVNLFVEKPLSDRLESARNLTNECLKAKVKLMIGYNLRFLSSLNKVHQIIKGEGIGRVVSAKAEVGQYLPDWRPGTDYRQSVSANSHLGGGVLLELSHEIDYLLWMLGGLEAVYARASRLGELDIDVEDNAELILEFQKGAVVSLHLDMLQRTKTRSFKLIGTQGTLTWDYVTGRVRLFQVASGQWQEFDFKSSQEVNQSYLDEIKHFFNCLESGNESQVSVADGCKVLEVIEAARLSSAQGRMVSLEEIN